MNKNIPNTLTVLGIITIVALFTILLLPHEEEQNNKLTSSQIDALAKMGALPIYVNLPENKNDMDTGLTYQTPYGTCHLNQDIFGRYYCKW